MVFYTILPMKKKAVIIIIIVIIVILLGVATYLFIKGGDKNKRKKDTDEDGDMGGGSGNIPVSSPTAPAPTNEFPLRRGSRGEKVKRLQIALASNPCLTQLKVNKVEVPEPDGIFGGITEKALKTCFNITSVSQTMYNGIIAGSQPMVTPSSIVVGNVVKTKQTVRGLDANGKVYTKGGSRGDGFISGGLYAGVVKGFKEDNVLGTLAMVDNFTYFMRKSDGSTVSRYYLPLSSLTK